MPPIPRRASHDRTNAGSRGVREDHSAGAADPHTRSGDQGCSARSLIRNRLLRLVRVIGAVVITVGVAAGASGVALYLTGPNGSISCAIPAPPDEPDRIPRWVIAAGIPALIAGFVGAFFALGAGRVLWQLVALVLVVAFAAATFYGVYLLLPPDCRP